MVEHYIRSAWKGYKKNFWPIIGGIVLITVVTLILFALAMAPMFSIMSANPQGDGAAIINGYLNNPGYFVFSASMLIIMLLVSGLLKAGFIKLLSQALKGKAEVSIIFDIIKKKFMSIIFANVIVCVIMLLTFFPLFILFVLMGYSLVFLPFLIIYFIFSVLLALFFSYTNYAIVIDNKPAMKAVHISINTVQKCLGELAALVIITMLASFAVGFVPFLGSLLNLALISPVMSLAIVALYLKRRVKK